MSFMFDALTNYITALGYNTENDELFQNFEDEEVKPSILGATLPVMLFNMFLMALD